MEKELLDQVIADTATLARIHDPAKRASFRQRFMEELDVVDDEGRIIGRAPRGLVHRLGLRHKTVYVLLISPDHTILLQRRGSDAASSPLRLDISVGGHVKAGELDPLRSATREMAEELGLEPDPARMKFAGEYNRDSSISLEKPYERNRERRFLFLYSLTDEEVAKIDIAFVHREAVHEVESFDWFTIPEVVTAINSGRVADGLGSNFVQWLSTQ